MRELIDMIAAFDALHASGKPSALATVVGVEGSAYRHPGARMLIAEDGRTWGGVSGGCLERDVAQRGRGVIASGRPYIFRYETTGDDEPNGLATGCGGTIDVLLQPITSDSPGPFPFLRRLSSECAPISLCTIIRATGDWSTLLGQSADLELPPNDWPAVVVATALDAASERRAGLTQVIGTSARADLFIETVLPPQQLVICGAGSDVLPLVRMAKLLGWRVTVVSSSASHSISERFSEADRVILATADHPLEGVNITATCAVVVMTHNVFRDGAILAALSVRPRYLGILGPKHRTDRLIEGAPFIASMSNLFSPVGLDLGAERPEEIALAILAEIQGALCGGSGQSLRDLDRPIHFPAARAIPTRPVRSIACPL